MKDLLIVFVMFICGYTFNSSKNIDTPNIDNQLIEDTIQIYKPASINNDKSDKVVTHVTLTCYQPVAAQCNDDYLHTADNSYIDLNKLASGDIKWVAISQDLLWLIPMGSKVKITDEKTGKYYGTYIVKDKMNKRWNHRMDILIHPDSDYRIYAEHIRVEVV